MLKFHFPTFLFIFFCAPFTLLNARSPQREPVLIVEPSFYHRPLECLIPGARKTVVTAAWMDPLHPTSFFFLKPSLQTIQPSWMDSFFQKGRNSLSEHLALLTPRFVRDEHQIILTAILESNDPLAASTILAPNFGEEFIKIFGPQMLIAIPSASRIYVFSKLLSALPLLAPVIKDDYLLATIPLSLEIFELDFKLGERQLHAIGSLESL